MNRHYTDDRTWVDGKIRQIRDMQGRETPLRTVRMPPGYEHLSLHVKDETKHPSGSHKHRLAEALFLNALANGWLTRHTPVVEASSGSTAISEAWFSKQLGVRFVAVVPEGTAKEKLEKIKELDGEVVLVKKGVDLGQRAREEARARKGHFMDQFTYAERAYDWRSDHGIPGEIFRRLDPAWFVMGAGTGGTATSFARHARYAGHKTQVCVTDPENSAFFPGWWNNDRTVTAKGSRIEGIGRPKVEASFMFPLVNRMIRVPDAASIGTMRAFAERLGTKPGGSTGTGLYGALRVLRTAHAKRERGGVVTLLCDSGDRYLDTYYNEEWLREQKIVYKPWKAAVERFLDTGVWTPPTGAPGQARR